MNMHVRPPAESLDSFSINLLTQERARQTALWSLARLKKEAEAEVERLLIFLDTIDGYTLSEREPSLGAPEIPPVFDQFYEKYRIWLEQSGDQTRWAAGSDDDREDQCEDEGDCADSEEHEPSGIGDLDGLIEQVSGTNHVPVGNAARFE